MVYRFQYRHAKMGFGEEMYMYKVVLSLAPLSSPHRNLDYLPSHPRIFGGALFLE